VITRGGRGKPRPYDTKGAVVKDDGASLETGFPDDVA
jgi:hypothetical protein